jgi:hypothetical protein
MNFTVAITGFDLVMGKVRCWGIRYIMKPFPLTDVNLDRKVNLSDLIAVARGFGATPGKFNFDFKADVNSDYRVNLSDLVKTALDFGNDY